MYILIMLYSKTCEYALRSLSYFVDKGEGAKASAAVISRETGVPGAYVAKIFQCLTQKGVLASSRGVKGGYSLKSDSSKIKLLDIIRAMDDLEKSPLSNCIMGLHQCNDKNPCLLHHTWADAKELMLKQLSRNSIADIAGLVDKFETGRCDRISLSPGMRALFAN